jgi:multidrug efflux pump subunit AcrA (membrane-fusion protein)
VQSIIDQMTVYAPVASQVYQRNVEPGEYVSPGVPLVTLIDLSDLWIHFDLREDLVKTLKVGDHFDPLHQRATRSQHLCASCSKSIPTSRSRLMIPAS